MKPVALLLTILSSSIGIAQRQPTKSREAAIAHWRTLMPVIKNVLKEHKLNCDYMGSEWEPAIVDAADFSSRDHMTAALVNWCNGGASTDAILAMNLEQGKPVVSRFLNGKNQPQTVEFLSGSSVTHSDSVELVPEKNAIFSFHSMDADVGYVYCGVKAFVWEPQARAFKLDTALTNKATQNRCRPR